jgi:hypothetical protein
MGRKSDPKSETGRPNHREHGEKIKSGFLKKVWTAGDARGPREKTWINGKSLVTVPVRRGSNREDGGTEEEELLQ